MVLIKLIDGEIYQIVQKTNDVNIVSHVILKYNLGTFLKCESDGATSIDLVRLNQHWQMWDRLYEFGHHKTLNENYEESSSKQQKDKINEYCLDGFRISIFSSRTNFRMCCYYY